MRVVVFSAWLAIGCRGAPAPRADAAMVPADARVVGDGARAAVTCGPTDPVVADADGLAFLAHVGGTMHVDLSEPPGKYAPTDLRSERPSPTARITAVSLALYKLVDDARVPLTAAELDRVIFRGSVLRLRSFGGVVAHTAGDCEYTLRDLLDAIETTDLQTRGDSPWFEGVDVHHVLFQGLSPAADGTWRVGWAG